MRLRQAVILLLVVSAAACTKWVADTRPLPTEPGKYSSRLRVHTVGDRVLVIARPWLRADSIVGWSGGRGVTLATADVTKIERQVVDGVRTGLTVVGVGLVVAGLVALGSAGPDYSSWGGRVYGTARHPRPATP